MKNLPTRIDYDIAGWQDATLEFQLTDENGFINITADTVSMSFADDEGGTPLLPKVIGPGQHSDPANGKTQVSFSKADLTTRDKFTTTRWWYEIRRIVGGTLKERLHIVGELRIQPSPASQ